MKKFVSAVSQVRTNQLLSATIAMLFAAGGASAAGGGPAPRTPAPP
jgi:hypothetical protein